LWCTADDPAGRRDDDEDMSSINRSPGLFALVAFAVVYGVVAAEVWMCVTGTIAALVAVLLLIAVVAALICRSVVRLLADEDGTGFPAQARALPPEGEEGGAGAGCALGGRTPQPQGHGERLVMVARELGQGGVAAHQLAAPAGTARKAPAAPFIIPAKEWSTRG
jgi:hypothetical protein